jgi:hypothetical protein
MAYTPTHFSPGFDGSSTPAAIDDQELSQRISWLGKLNPYMAQRPDLLAQMGQLPVDTETLMAIGGQTYAMQAGDDLATQLKGLSGGTQRAIFSRLTPGQQSGLATLGYQPPERHESGVLNEVSKVVAPVVGGVVHGIGAVTMPVAKPALEGLTWVMNQPGHIYRTVALQDGEGRAAGVVGALAGAGLALALAVPTGGGSLALAGAIGLGALGGAAAGSFGATIQNPSDWYRAFNQSWNGEKTFTQRAKDHVEELLGDPRMVGIAQDLAGIGIDPVELALEMAGHRDVSINSQIAEMQKLAGKMAAPGSMQFKEAMTSMTNVLQDETFQKAVKTLNESKVSPGRDFADVFHLSPGSKPYSLISGSTDALFTVAVDPTLLLGYGAKAWMAKKYTLPLLDGADRATVFRKFVDERPSVKRVYDYLADAVEHMQDGGLMKIRENAPQMEAIAGDLWNYRQTLIDEGHLSKVPFSGSDVIEYLTNQTNMHAVLEGMGSVRNARGVQLYAVGPGREWVRGFRADVRNFVNGMSDSATHAKALKLARKHGTSLLDAQYMMIQDIARTHGRDFEQMLGSGWNDVIGKDGLIDKPWMFFSNDSPTAYTSGRAFADKARTVPYLGRGVGRVGSALSSMTTMSISSKAIMLTGPGATQQIRALTDLGRFSGMESWATHAWADTILSARDAGARWEIMHGWLANVLRLGGLDATPEGERLVNQYLELAKHAHGGGDEILVNGHVLHAGLFLNEQADRMVMPDLHELRKASLTGLMGKAMGITDLPIVEPLMNKIWKPLVLLRIGFIPRAAGEEGIAFLMRGGLGGLIQGFGARFMGEAAAYEEANRLQAAAKAAGHHITFTEEQKRLLAMGERALVPHHVRPVVRMAARYNFEDPVMRKMLNYSAWLRRHLAAGVGQRARVYSATEQHILNNIHTPMHNLKTNMDSILFGNEFSLRRMMLGGVHDDMLEAGREWANGHLTTVMRELSATNAHPLDPGFDTSLLHKELIVDPVTKQIRPMTMMSEKSMRTTLARGDDGFQNAYLDNLQKSLAEPALRDDALEYLTRTTGGVNVTEGELGPMADHLFDMGKGKTAPATEMGRQPHGYQARALMQELMGDFDKDHWDQFLVELARGKRRTRSGEFAQVLHDYMKEYDRPTVEGVKIALRKKMATMSAKDFKKFEDYEETLDHFKALERDLDEHATPIMQWLNSKPPAERAFATQFLDHQVNGGEESFWMRKRRTPPPAPVAPVAPVAAAAAPTSSVFTPTELAYQQTFHTSGHTAYNRIRQEMTPDVADELFPALASGTLDQLAGYQLRSIHDELDDMVREVRLTTHGEANAELASLENIRKHVVKAEKHVAANPRAAQTTATSGWMQMANDMRDEIKAPNLPPTHYMDQRRANPGAFEQIDPNDEAQVEAARMLHWSRLGIAPEDIPTVARRAETEAVGFAPTTIPDASGGFVPDGIHPAPPAVGAPESDRWLYRDLQEVRDRRNANMANAYLDPQYHDPVSHSMRMNERNELGNFEGTEVHSGSVSLYEAPPLSGATFEAVLANTTNRKLIMDNEKVVRRLTEAVDPNDTVVLANYHLAEELGRVRARIAGVSPDMAAKPRMLRMSRGVNDGRVHGMLRPETIVNEGDTPRMWFYPRAHADKILGPTPNQLVDPAETWAKDSVARLDDLIRRRNTQTVRFKQRVLEDGTTEPTVYSWEDGVLTGIGPDEDVDMSRLKTLVDHNGQPIHFGDSTFATQPMRETDGAPSNDIMWEVLSNTMRDASRQKYSMVRYRNKRETSAYSLRGKPSPSLDLVPMQRAKPTDVDRAYDGSMNAMVLGELPNSRRATPFEKVVTYGFDRMIGPSIDAIARKPMAFHYYAKRYIAAKRQLEWTLDPALIDKVQTMMAGYRGGYDISSDEVDHLAEIARVINRYHGDKQAAVWKTDQALSWFRGHNDAELKDWAERTITATNGDASNLAKRANGLAKDLLDTDTMTVRRASAFETNHAATLDRIEGSLPENGLKHVLDEDRSESLTKIIRQDPLLDHIDKTGQWDLVIAAHTNLATQRKAAGEIAATAAIADAMPFIDSHEFKTQFADHAKGLMPFWYAEENFMKRWARGLIESPEMVAKMQLSYMGLKSAGVVRTDQSGHDWFVYPGSGLLIHALSKLPGLSALQGAGVLFESPTDQMLPGVNNRFGTPSFLPLVTVPVSLGAALFPALEPVERSMVGDYASTQNIVSQLVPAHFRNLASALFQGNEKNQRFMAAMNAGMAFAVAHGQDPPDDASPQQVQDFMDQIRNHAHIIALAQAIGGFINPGSTSAVYAGDSGEGGIGLKVDNPADYLASEYLELVQSLGVEEGTQKYLELNPRGTIDDIVNPLAYTVPRSQSTSGAPLPSGPAAFAFMQANGQYLDEFPNAAPWLFPAQVGGDRSQYVFDQQVADKLRKQRKPDEFYAAIKFKLGAQNYFGTKDAFTKLIDEATVNGDKARAKSLQAQMEYQLNIYRIAHPLFAEELQSSDGRIRRGKILAEMRTVVEDPAHPDVPQFNGLRVMMRTFDNYGVRLSVLGNDRSAAGKRETEFLKRQYEEFMKSYVEAHPELQAFWVSVLRPESSLS